MVTIASPPGTDHLKGDLFYVAYGSNLHPGRLQQRLSGVTLTARIQLPRFNLHFHKLGADGSGKCDIVPGQGRVLGTLYRLSREQAQQLDVWEGGYERQALEVEFDERSYTAYTYRAKHTHISEQAQPYDWYLALVQAGARALNFTPEYQQQLALNPCQQDLNRKRAEQHWGLVSALEQHSGPSLAQLPWAKGYETSTIS